MLGVLPFFHSFGFTGTLWFPLIAGIGTGLALAELAQTAKAAKATALAPIRFWVLFFIFDSGKCLPGVIRRAIKDGQDGI